MIAGITFVGVVIALFWLMLGILIGYVLASALAAERLEIERREWEARAVRNLRELRHWRV